ncbi:MAG: hypothetical protein A2070_06750 [Bdellovibrionales bacterium GWC1_52_8]|nr:MAG: hypothetical protein A2Z97_04005 [Bdellovibrionales bacterium GWB1_52_6]OFZ04687.1 MAG: hypothetical protein A2X97_13985 [Bdellovibrionales bacterium GWA1_52_35]OFZ40945.1 MAG: hypothetical protein A2070_06750 [Bdellovibrionales bacterium GWC1_52_8]
MSHVDEDDSETELSDDLEPEEGDLASSMPTAFGGGVPAIIATGETDLVEAEISSSSVSDPLRRYMDELKRYPLMESEQEFKLALKLRNEGDVQAAKALVSANLRLVVKIALEYRTFYSNLLDLIQEGNIGLMKAVSKFDPTRGARLGYYASWWIRSYILKYLLDNFRLVKIGTTQAQKKLFYHLMREKQRIEAQGLLGGPKLLAERLQVREKDIIEMEQRLSGQGSELSLDAPVSPNDGGKTVSHMEHLTDATEGADSVMEKQELLRILHNRLPDFQEQLNQKEVSILKDRLLAEEPKTLQEVADLYGLTRERARQIEAKVISKLRDFLKFS